MIPTNYNAGEPSEVCNLRKSHMSNVVLFIANDELKVAAEKLIDIIITQLKTLKTKKSDW